MDKKPVDEPLQQPKSSLAMVADFIGGDSMEHFMTREGRDVATQTGSQKLRVTNPVEPETLSHKVANGLAHGSSPNVQQKPKQDTCLSRSDVAERLEMIFSQTQYPDIYMVKELSVKLNVPKCVIATWFEKKRSEYRKEEQEKGMKYFQMQAMQQAYNQQLIAHTFQASAHGSASYTGQQPYLTAQHVNYMETLFTNGTRYPDISQLAAQLNVPEQYLAVWFEQRRDVWKKEQAKLAYKRMQQQEQQLQQQRMTLSQAQSMAQQHLQQQQQKQLQVGTGVSHDQVHALSCTEQGSFSEASNVPLVEKISENRPYPY